MLPIYSTVQSTHLYSLAGNLRNYTPFFPNSAGRIAVRPPAGLLGALEISLEPKDPTVCRCFLAVQRYRPELVAAKIILP